MSSGYYTNNYNTGGRTFGNHHEHSASNEMHYYGVVGEGQDMTNDAFDSSLATSNEDKKSWACPTCTFWNTGKIEKVCSMCGCPKSVQNTTGATMHAHVREEEPIPIKESLYETQHNIHAATSPHQVEDVLANEVIQSLPEGLDCGKVFISVNDIVSPKTSTHSNKSINVFNLSINSICSDLTENGHDFFEERIPSPVGGNNKAGTNLSARDFQMSFANWSISDQGDWTCATCTFVNTNPLYLKCEACGQNRPINSKGVAQESQNAMQDIMEKSFSTCQVDSMRQQQEKMEEIEERIIVAERFKEIGAMQEMLLHEVSETENKTTFVQQHKPIQRARMADNDHPPAIASSLPYPEPHMNVRAQEPILTRRGRTSRHRSIDLDSIPQKQRAVLEKWRNL